MATKYKKPLLLIALLVAWGLIFGFHSPWQASVDAPAPGPTSTPAAAGRTPGAQGGGLPRLKTELLDLPTPKYVPETQSIFGAPPPPPPPPPRPAVAANPSAAAPPPPDPFYEEAKRLRYVGFLRRADDQATAFIIQGQDVQTLEVGATLGGRFRVQAITEDAVLLTSPNGDKQVRIPIVALAGSTATPR
jgi:hypothetical protein